MRFVVAILTLAAMLAASVAVAEPPEVDTAAVLRLGDMVQHVDGIRADGDDLFVQAMATPENDADKWFISVLTMANCPPCDRLKRDFRESEYLRALADPANPQRSWAHYSVYSREDKSQEFRFANLRISGYPTVIVQPPRSGKFGPPATVVYQSTYGGDPESLARNIANAVRAYARKLSPSPSSPGVQQSPADGPSGRYEPPWRPPSRDELPATGPLSFPDGLPQIPPPSILTGVVGLSTVAVVVCSILATLAAIFVLPMVIRSWSAAKEQRKLEREAAYAQQTAMMSMIAKLAARGEGSSTATVSTPPSTPSPVA
jgi:hypothetical protein